jgi:hypothetical protein
MDIRLQKSIPRGYQFNHFYKKNSRTGNFLSSNNHVDNRIDNQLETQ